MITDWNIQSRSHHCGGCGKPFADKQNYHTLLLDQRVDLLRMDVCDSCWQQQYGEGAKERKGFVSYWQGVYEVPAPRPEPIQKETAESLLRKILDLKKPELGPAAYILAVMLERKRLLKVKEEIERDGRRIFVYEHAKSGDVFTIADPNLQLNQLEEVQRDVANLLKHGLEPAVKTATSEGQAPASLVAPESSPMVEGDDTFSEGRSPASPGLAATSHKAVGDDPQPDSPSPPCPSEAAVGERGS